MSRVQKETNRGNLDEFCPTYLISRWVNRPEDAGESWAGGAALLKHPTQSSVLRKVCIFPLFHQIIRASILGRKPSFHINYPLTI